MTGASRLKLPKLAPASGSGSRPRKQLPTPALARRRSPPHRTHPFSIPSIPHSSRRRPRQTHHAQTAPHEGAPASGGGAMWRDPRAGETGKWGCSGKGGWVRCRGRRRGAGAGTSVAEPAEAGLARRGAAPDRESNSQHRPWLAAAHPHTAPIRFQSQASHIPPADALDKPTTRRPLHTTDLPSGGGAAWRDPRAGETGKWGCFGKSGMCAVSARETGSDGRSSLSLNCRTLPRAGNPPSVNAPCRGRMA